jgi:hypothetical protein
MLASQTWSEWHLTPRGWESSEAANHADLPADRVLTCEDLETSADFAGEPCHSLKIIWHCDDSALVRELMLRYGHCPPPRASAKPRRQAASG